MAQAKSSMGRSNVALSRVLLAWTGLALAAVSGGCQKSVLESKVRDQRQDTIPGVSETKVRISAIESNGRTKGAVAANAMYTQVLEAGSNTSISGSSAVFPPGSLAIDTEVSLSTTSAIGNTATLERLELGTEVARSGAAVEILSSTPTDAAAPFTLAIPLPDGSGLNLSQDQWSNLSIVYFVKKVSQGSVGFTGIIPRSMVDVSSGYAKFTTTFFGTFQAIITAKPIDKAVEKAIEPVTGPKPDPKVVLAPQGFYASGFMTTSFEPALSGQRQEGLQGMLTPLSPYWVGSSRRLSSTFLSYDLRSE